jgi:LPPG:FO 2-phospho-L-lactate transferase
MVELAGGVGGAKLADGLQVVVGSDLAVVVNTGDDLVRHGLTIWPDHDTVAYTLAGLDDAERGWGLAGETWTVMDRMAVLGDDPWFRLGDRDLATHLWRSDRLRDGRRPTAVALEMRERFGMAATVLPMTDAEVRTEILTDDGWLEFQEYFVHRHQEPEVRDVRFRGIETASPTAEVVAAVEAAELVVIGPSNPIVSIGPILAVPGMANLLARARATGTPIVAVSGIVGGRALKGPADRMLASLGHESSATSVAALLAPHLDGFVLDAVDAGLEPSIAALGLRTLVTDTIMGDDAGRAALNVAAPAGAPAIELLVFERADCTYCRVFRRDIVPKYRHAVRDDAVPLRFVDIDKSDPGSLALKARIDTLPTAVLMKNGSEFDRIVGYWGPDNFFKLLAHILARME